MRTSYAGLRPKPQARGRCHDANYWELTQILSSDVDAPHSIAVIRPATLRATEHPPGHLAPHVLTVRAGSTGVGLFLQEDLHPKPFCLIGEFEAHAPMRPLVNLLVVRRANIVALPKIAHIANHERLDACFMQRRYQVRRLLVLDLVNLLFDLLELFLFGTDDPLAPLAALLHVPIDAAVESRLQLIAVLHFGTQEPPVEDMGLGAIMTDRHMDFPKINPGHFPDREGAVQRLLLVGRNRLVLCAYPVNHDRLWGFPRPDEYERGIAFAVGEGKHPVLVAHGTRLVLNTKVPLALVRGFGVWVACFLSLSPTLEGSEEGLHAGIGGMGMEVGAGMPAHQVFGLEPDALLAHRAPEGDQCLAVEPAAFAGQFIQLVGLADRDPSYLIVLHRYLFFFSAAKAVMGTRLKPAHASPLPFKWRGLRRAKAPFCHNWALRYQRYR